MLKILFLFFLHLLLFHALILNLAFEVLLQQLHRLATVSHSLHVGMSGNTNNASTRELREVGVQELLRHGPGDQIACASRSFA